jgi:diguanylate cyclase (GGDEF)-like protein
MVDFKARWAAMSSAKEGTLKPQQIVTGAAVFLCLDGICAVIPRLHSDAVSYGFEILAPLLALTACIWRVRRAGNRVRTLWFLLAAGVAFWCCGILLSAWEDMFQHIPFEVVFFSDFAFFFSGVPVLFALSTPVEGQRFALFGWLDGIQAAFAGYLTYITIFSVLPFSTRSMHPISIDLLVMTYNVENAVLALSCGLRLLAAPRRGDERRFYRTLLLFLVAYTVGTGLYNRLAVAMPGHEPPDLLATTPFILLAALALAWPREAEDEGVGRRTPAELFIDNASPIFFTLALLTLGLVVLRSYFATGIVAIGVALAVYAIRTTVLQIRYLQAQRALQEARDRVEAISLQDGLTGIANRRCFDQTLEKEWYRAVRAGQPLALLLIDLDFFKNLNDTQGHQAGDRCLVEVAYVLSSIASRSGDMVARYGGEEFAVILPETMENAALALAERMRAAVSALMIANETLVRKFVTLSIGVAVYAPAEEGSRQGLLAASDRALYRAKQLGRNRVERAAMEIPDEPSE